MKRVHGLVALLLTLCAALLAIGCGSEGDSGSSASTSSSGGDKVDLTAGRDLTFAMVTHGDAGSFWSVVKRGAEQAAKDEGVELQYSESANDPQKQAQLLEAAITSRVDGIVVSLPNLDAMKAGLAKAKDAGIPVIITNAGGGSARDVGAIGSVGQDETIAGQAIGERLKSEGASKVLCVIHEQSNASLTQRCDGVKDTLGGTLDTMQITGTANIATSLAEMKSKLRASDYDAVVTLNGDVAAAAVDAIKGAGSDAKLGTFDLSGPVVRAIQDGTIEFAIDQQQYLQGYLPIVFLTLYRENSNTVGGGGPVLTGPAFVDKENADQVAQLAADGTR